MIPKIGCNYRLPDGRPVECIGRDAVTMMVYVCFDGQQGGDAWWINPVELTEM